MAEKKEVVIKLTDEQRQQIKSATGKDLAELKVGTVEDRANPFAEGSLLEARANPFSEGSMLEDRANPFSEGSLLEDRANPFSEGSLLEDRANPTMPIEE